MAAIPDKFILVFNVGGTSADPKELEAVLGEAFRGAVIEEKGRRALTVRLEYAEQADELRQVMQSHFGEKVRVEPYEALKLI